jgi:hypothetical protein
VLGGPRASSVSWELFVTVAEPATSSMHGRRNNVGTDALPMQASRRNWRESRDGICSMPRPPLTITTRCSPAPESLSTRVFALTVLGCGPPANQVGLDLEDRVAEATVRRAERSSDDGPYFFDFDPEGEQARERDYVELRDWARRLGYLAGAQRRHQRGEAR